MNSQAVDAAGRTHQRAGRDARIVSLVPSITELVCALGLADQLVGRTGFCIHPRELLRRVPKVGGTKDVKLEAVRALAPTHVIVNIDENERETVERLAAFVPHVIVTHPNAPEDNLALYRLLGAVFDREAAAQMLCRRLTAALDALRAGAWPSRKVVYAIWRDPWMTIARDTYIARTLACVRWETLPAVEGGPHGPARYPVFLPSDPWVQEADLVLLSTEPYRFRASHVAPVGALFGKPVAVIDGEMVSWYGSRAIDGLAYLARYAASFNAASLNAGGS